ncbi:glycosyltransferase family 4 protein [Niabella sp. CJ426]|uniref:glycosyltransferase family 4 protein n=1 Tax=Niabella sp. CJ426 TaxID=3393740 RepID=UPI003D07639A
MTIAFNCWVLRNKNVDGIGNVVIETLQLMIKHHPETHFMLLCDKNFNRTYFNFPNATIYRIFPPYRHPVLYFFYLEFILPAFLKRYQPDLFIGMDGMISLRSKTKQIAVIHDLNFEHFPENLPFRNRVYYKYFFKRFAKKADCIVTVSNYTKQDVIKSYHIPAEKIEVMPLGAKPIFQPITLTDARSTREHYTNGSPYFFFVGSMHARKNIQRLMQAFERFKSGMPNNFKLVLAGNILWEEKEIKSVYDSLEYKDDIIFPGRITDQELKYLLGAAHGLVFVPLFEGFGLPIVEAFQAGVPVICSNTSSMPEVAADAALLVDPFDVNDIAQAMTDIYQDGDLSIKLIRKGKERKQLFNWEISSEILYNAVVKTIS